MQLKNHAILLAVIDQLNRYGSWTGKTHVQKALSLLRDSGSVKVPFQFVLHKHGPYSFDIEGELENMQSYGAIKSEANMEGYGVMIQPGEKADYVRKTEPLTKEEIQAIEKVCKFMGPKNVSELERLATASWIRFQEHLTQPSDVAHRLHSLKPHVSLADAESAYKGIIELLS